ncbi:MAG TPA: DNA repair protein RadC [Proteobacteria bacterium]|nr:DNA repair protein RadC [Pseudomonadota bacterium]
MAAEKGKPGPDYLGHRQRLKERFAHQGFSGWQAYEILELLLGYAVPRRDVKPPAKELLRQFKTVKRVLDAPSDQLQQVAGLGPGGARFLKVCRELISVYLEAPEALRQSITSPEQVADICRGRLEGLPREEFLVLFLDNRHRLLAGEILHRGTVDMSVVYPREVLTRALQHRAAALIVAHNHPGGSCNPSADDVRLTEDLQQAAATLGIRLLDHLIVADRRVISLKELGKF